MSTRIKITAIRTGWKGKMLERYMNETLLLRHARNVGDEENVNNYVLGQLNKHQAFREIEFEKVKEN